jgi:multiple sugar transport system substrate-binding protein
MKKVLVSLLLLVTLVANIFMLAGCDLSGLLGGNNEAPAKIVENFDLSQGGYDGSEVTIVFAHTMGANLREVLDAYIVEFNKIYPNIKVEHSQVGGYDDVRDDISTQIGQGLQPNISYCYPDHVALYNLANAVVNLNAFIEHPEFGLTNEQIADFIPGYYQEGTMFGHETPDGDPVMYTLPFSKSTEVLYYNKTFFEANNLKLPTTWVELEALCRKIKEIDPTCIPLGYDSEANWFITMCEQYGSEYTSATGDHFRFDNETNHNFVKMFNTWYQDGLVTTQKLYGGYTSGLFVNQEGTRSYMSIGSSAGATHQRPAKVNNEYPFEVGIAQIPQVNPANPKVISQGPSVCIFQDTANSGNITYQEVMASWLFVKFFTTSVEFQAEFGIESGYIPVLKSVSQNPIYAAELASADGYEHVAALSAKVAMEQANAYYTSPAFNGSSKARDEVGALLQAALVINKDKDVDAEIKKLFEEAVEECEYSI